MTGKFILNADDFGSSKALNRAVLEAYDSGLLKSVSLIPNGDFFEEAVDNILPKCPDIGVGIHLNLISGKSLCSDVDKLTGSDMKFSNNFFTLFAKLYNPKEKDILSQIEREFRRQIEKVLAKTKVSHIDSHAHIHSIPVIFDMVCRLAKEYGISEVRTHFEKFYFVPEIYGYINKDYFCNALKKLMLNFFTIVNQNTVLKYGLSTNDYIIGVGYASCMTPLAVMYGLNVLKKYKNITVETVIHPHRYDEGTINNHFDEYMLAKNNKLKDKILSLGYDITNYIKNSENDGDK